MIRIATTPAPVVALVALAAVMSVSAPALAHQASITHSQVSVSDDRRSVTYTIKFEPPDVSEMLALGTDVNPTDEQVARGATGLLDYVLKRVRVGSEGATCHATHVNVETIVEGARFVQARFRVTCDRPIGVLAVDYDLFFDLDKLHRTILKVAHDGRYAVAELSNDDRRFTWNLDEAPPSGLVGFLKSGVEHIATGFDHLAFLVGLLLIASIAPRPTRAGDAPAGDAPAGDADAGDADAGDADAGDADAGDADAGDADAGDADGTENAGWQLRPLRDSLKYTALIVTSFTVAHSLTLIAASLGWIALSSRVVESLIAASIVYVAIENIIKPDARYRYTVTFAFGLMHGMGFASLLAVMLPPEDMLWPLLMFNLGVELGQLVVVAVLMPPLHLLTRALGPTSYRAWVLPLLSGLLALIGLSWMLERVFDTVILGL